MSDYPRLGEWTDRLKDWKEQGVKHVNFFVHQNVEMESPLLSAHLIKQMNTELKTDLHIPQTLSDLPEAAAKSKKVAPKKETKNKGVQGKLL